MPGDTEIVLKCAQCGAITRYTELYQNGKFRPNHTLECSAAGDPHPQMRLTFQAKNPSV